MVDFTRLQATAQRLIRANGRDVQLVDPGAGAGAVLKDVNKPWRGVQDPRADANAVKRDVRGVFVTLSGSSGLGEELVAAGVNLNKELRKYLMFSPADLEVGQDSRQFVEIVDGSETFRVVDAQVLRPADLDLLAFLETES